MMRLSWATMAFMGVVATAFLASPTSAIAQQGSEQLRVNVYLKGADLFAATKFLTDQAGLQFVFESSDDQFGKVTLKLDEVTPEEALAYICKCAGASFRKDVNGVYIIGKQSAEADVEAAAPVAKIVRVLQRIKVRNADVRNVYDMLMFATPMDSGRGFDDLKKFRKQVDNRDDFNPYSFRPDVVNSLSPSYQPVNPRVPEGLTSSESGGDISLPGESGNQVGGPGGFGGGRGGQGGGNGGRGGGQGNGLGGGNNGGRGGGQGGNGQGTTLTGGQGLVPNSIDFISYDPTDNSLVVRGTEEDIAELQRSISLFDVPPRQVEIKVEFITTTDDLDKSIGFDFLYQRGTVFAGTAPGAFARTSDPVFLNYATGNVTSRMRALLQEGRGKVVQSPILRTLNNQPATINSSITSWIFFNTTTISNGTVVTNSNPYPLQAQTSLSIAPRINEDNTITVYLAPAIQSFVGTTRGPDGSELPNISNQSISVVARVKNGETIVLGGLTNKNDNTVVSRVPLLSDLPILGQFFRSTKRTKRNSDLLIFVTPRVVEEDDVTGGG